MARHDLLIAPADGPDDMYSSDLGPSRGQFQAIATLAADLLGAPLTTRLDASAMIVRLHRALEEQAAIPAPDDPSPF